MAILSILLTVVIVAVSVLIVLIVLVQRPKQEGLGAAFGGSTLDSALGAHTTDVLQKITTWLGIIFFVSAIGLAMVRTREFRASAASDVLEGVENREPNVPGLPPGLSNLPDLDAPANVDDGLSLPDGNEDAPEGAAPGEGTSEAPEAGNEGKEVAPGTDAPEAAAPSESAPEGQPKSEGAPSEESSPSKGKDKGEG